MTLFLSDINIRAAIATAILIIATIFNKSVAQELKIHKGIILSSDTTLFLKDVEVKNLNSNICTTSDSYGYFTIQYRLSDTIEFKHRDWETKSLVGHRLYDSVFMAKKGIALEEVIITANRSNTLLHDLEKLKGDLNKKNGIYYEGRPPLALLNPFGGKPITFFYELLSKGGRQARKMKSTIQTEYERNEVDEVFNASSIRTVIDIDDSEMERFLRQFRPTLEDVHRWSVYDFQVYVKKCFTSFTKD